MTEHRSITFGQDTTIGWRQTKFHFRQNEALFSLLCNSSFHGQNVSRSRHRLTILYTLLRFVSPVQQVTDPTRKGKDSKERLIERRLIPFLRQCHCQEKSVIGTISSIRTLRNVAVYRSGKQVRGMKNNHNWVNGWLYFFWSSSWVVALCRF